MKQNAPLDCGIGLCSLRSRTEAHIFVPVVRSYSRPGLPASAHKKGWVIAASVCGTIEALTWALVELASIRVNAVSPGVVRTNLSQNMTIAEQERLYESVGNRLPVGRVGEPRDIAQAYLFSMQEGFGTGLVVVVDGGTVLV